MRGRGTPGWQAVVVLVLEMATMAYSQAPMSSIGFISKGAGVGVQKPKVKGEWKE